MAWRKEPVLIQTYEEWKAATGITEEDERIFKERLRKRRDCPPDASVGLRRLYGAPIRWTK